MALRLVSLLCIPCLCDVDLVFYFIVNGFDARQKKYLKEVSPILDYSG